MLADSVAKSDWSVVAEDPGQDGHGGGNQGAIQGEHGGGRHEDHGGRVHITSPGGGNKRGSHAGN